jgi:hypothetical protein
MEQMTERERLEIKLLKALAREDMRYWRARNNVEARKDPEPRVKNSKKPAEQVAEQQTI